MTSLLTRPRPLRTAATMMLVVAGCAGSGALRAARSGDRAALHTQIAAERLAGKLDRPRVRAIARAVAVRAIADGDASAAAARIAQVAPCARPLAGALRERSQGHGPAAATATLALIDARASAADRDDLVRAHAGARDAAWRAVAARSAEGPDHGPVRRTLYVDPDEGVRLAALRAGLATPDPADAPALRSVLRLDPNPLAQSLAARSLGQFANEQVVLDLADAYQHADETLRQSIVDAWGMRAWSAGGQRELVRVVETDHGLAAIEAAAVLARSRDADAAHVGTRALARAIESGAAAARLLAIVHAPLDDAPTREALTRATKASDADVQVAALGRLAHHRDTRASAVSALRALAAGHNLPALLALADLGDRSATPGLVRHLGSLSRTTRLSAARALISLGEETRTADFLTDDDAELRWSVACAITGNDPG